MPLTGSMVVLTPEEVGALLDTLSDHNAILNRLRAEGSLSPAMHVTLTDELADMRDMLVEKLGV